jgi:hypothetical protein
MKSDRDYIRVARAYQATYLPTGRAGPAGRPGLPPGLPALSCGEPRAAARACGACLGPPGGGCGGDCAWDEEVGLCRERSALPDDFQAGPDSDSDPDPDSVSDSEA